VTCGAGDTDVEDDPDAGCVANGRLGVSRLPHMVECEAWVRGRRRVPVDVLTLLGRGCVAFAGCKMSGCSAVGSGAATGGGRGASAS
jgi:hypothetical protein